MLLYVSILGSSSGSTYCSLLKLNVKIVNMSLYVSVMWQHMHSLEWKNAQTNETKNKISDTLNRIIPHHRPFVTIFVCNPRYVPSRVTSRHHWIMVNRVIIAPMPSKLSSYWWNHLINPIRITIAPIAPVNGQGLLFMGL